MTPTNAEYEAADAIAEWLGHNPRHVRERIAQIISVHCVTSAAERDETDILNAGAAGLARALLNDDGHGEMSPGPCADALALVRGLRAALAAERETRAQKGKPE